MNQDLEPGIRKIEDDLAVIFARLQPSSPEALAEDERRRRTANVSALARQVGKRYWPQQCSLGTFQIYHDNQKPVLKLVRSLAGDIATRCRMGQGVVFHGPTGTGKDHLALSLMYLAAHQLVHCRWVLGTVFFADVWASFKDGRSLERLMSPYIKPELLCLSDPLPPGKNALEGWQVQALYNVLDARNRRHLPTWATLNVIDDKEADCRLQPQVWDRLRHDAEVILCQWPSYRMKT